MKKQLQEEAKRQTWEKPIEIMTKKGGEIKETELTKPFEIEKTKIFQESRLQTTTPKSRPFQSQVYTRTISQPPTSLQERVFKPRFVIPVLNPPKIEPTAQSIEEAKEINLGKLNMLLRDKAITMIECPGPKKPVLVKRINQLNITKVSLSQQEINNIIEEFSKKARIPVIGGVFKTTVGNLTISAVISEFVGSRFIITKSSPYNLIEQKTQQTSQRQQAGQSPKKFEQPQYKEQPKRFT